MPGPSAVLFNHETGAYEEVPSERVGAAISSGKYTATASSVDTQAEGGVVARPIEQMGAAAIQGETEAGGVNAAKASAARRASQMSALSDPALTFVEGVGDALTVGLLHGTRPEDELRREEDSGSALAGQLAGMALGLKLPGPISGLAKGGEALGEGLGRALLGEVGSGFRGVIEGGLKEAGANAALMAASAFGHQITDAVLADKPFAAESIASEAGLGSLLGFGFGFVGTGLGQLAKASRGAVEASGIASKESRAALDAVHDMTGAWDEALETHSRRVGVLKVLADDGHIPGEFTAERSAAVRKAEAARDALRAIDPEKAFSGDPGQFKRWRDAVERYQEAVSSLNDKMSPSPLERAHANPVKMGNAKDLPRAPHVPGDIDAAEAANGLRSPMSYDLDNAMTPEARAKYREIYGRDFQPTPGVGAVGEENLGGRRTATSDTGTNPGTRRRAGGPVETAGDDRIAASSRPANTIGEYPPGTELYLRRDAAEAERFNKPLAKARPTPGTIDAEGHTITARQVLEAGEAPRSVGETGADFVEHAQKRLAGSVESEAGPKKPPIDPMQGKKAVRDYLNSWFREYDGKPRVSVGDQLNARLMAALDNIAKTSGSRLDSAGALGLLKALGLKEANSPLGQRLDQVWSLGQAGKFAADEARGVKTPLRKHLADMMAGSDDGVAGVVKRYELRKLGRKAGAAAFGGAIGGPVGAILGYALTSAGFAGGAAATAGKLMKQVAIVGEALLKGRRATLAVHAVMGNRPYQYSETGPIKDPIERILEVQRLAANPDAIRARVTHQLGDLAITSPELADHLINTAIQHVTAIAQSAPSIMMSPIGTPIKPSSTALNRFYDFENALHDLPGVLDAMAKGTASTAQIKALQIGFPAVHEELVRNVLGEHEALSKLNEAKLRTMERALGIPLTRSTLDPTVTSRYQGNWDSPQPAPQPAQAFKINAPKPTPVQSASSGRAPGNERKP